MANPFSTKMWDCSSSRFLFNQPAGNISQKGDLREARGHARGNIRPDGTIATNMVTTDGKKCTKI